MNKQSTLTIEHLRSVYRAAADDPAPEELRSRFDRMATDEMMHACRRRLSEWMNDEDSSIWLIRSVDVDLAIDASAHSVQRAGLAWGEQLAVEIGRVLEHGPSDTVVTFADRAAYVAQWARDRAAGHGFDKWYYAEFDSLRSLPRSAAIAEAILREGDAAPEIVLRLHEAEVLDHMLAALTSRDAERVYHAVAAPGGAGLLHARQWTPRLLALWNGAVLNAETSMADAIRLWAAARVEWPNDNVAGLRFAIDRLLELRNLLRKVGPPEVAPQFLIEAIAGRLKEASAMLAEHGIDADGSLLEFAREASGGNPEWASFVSSSIASSANASRDEQFLSELGGVFLLASAFRDLRIDAATQVAALSCDEPARAAAVLRLLLAVRCLGRDRAALAIHDPAVAEFAGMARTVTLGEMAPVLQSADGQAALEVMKNAMREARGEEPEDDMPEEHREYFAIAGIFPELQLGARDEHAWSWMALAVLRNFARRLSGFAASSPEYLFRNFMTGTSQVRLSEKHIEVRMAQCPLAMVLRIAGAYQTLELPWREGVEICLLAPPD